VSVALLAPAAAGEKTTSKLQKDLPATAPAQPSFLTTKSPACAPPTDFPVTVLAAEPVL